MLILSQDNDVLFDTACGPVSGDKWRERDEERCIVGETGDMRLRLGKYDSEEEATAKLRALGQRSDVIRL